MLVAAGATAIHLARPRRAPPADPGPRVVAALVAGIERAIAVATALREPFRCAELAEGQTPPRVIDVRGRALTHDGFEVTAAPVRGDRTLVLGVVADARGAEPETLAQLERVRRTFAAGGVELVLSLGGMGQTQDAIAAALGALVDPGWLLVALPGDRESIPAHQAAVAALIARGAPVIDGARARLLAIDGASIATLPGLAEAAHLTAGADGCRHTPADAAVAAALVAARPPPRLWAGYAPPRQRGADASDLTLDGIHVGEVELADGIAAADASLILSAQVDEAALGDLTGTTAVPAPTPRFLACGAIEALPLADADPPRTGSALLVTVSRRQIRWRRIAVRDLPRPEPLR